MSEYWIGPKLTSPETTKTIYFMKFMILLNPYSLLSFHNLYQNSTKSTSSFAHRPEMNYEIPPAWKNFHLKPKVRLPSFQFHIFLQGSIFEPLVVLLVHKVYQIFLALLRLKTWMIAIAKWQIRDHNLQFWGVTQAVLLENSSIKNNAYLLSFCDSDFAIFCLSFIFGHCLFLP